MKREDILKIPEMVKTMRVREIGETFGVSDRTITKWIKRLKEDGFDVPVRKGPRPIKLK